MIVKGRGPAAVVVAEPACGHRDGGRGRGRVSRLVHTPWLDAFRLTTAGAQLLGRIFSLWNLVAYFAGIVVGVWLDRLMEKRGAGKRQPASLFRVARRISSDNLGSLTARASTSAPTRDTRVTIASSSCRRCLVPEAIRALSHPIMPFTPAANRSRARGSDAAAVRIRSRLSAAFSLETHMSKGPESVGLDNYITIIISLKITIVIKWREPGEGHDQGKDCSRDRRLVGHW